jgi:hypothetical protein
MKKTPEETTASLAAKLNSSTESDQESNRTLNESEYEKKSIFMLLYK